MNKSALRQEAFFYALIWVLLYITFTMVVYSSFDSNRDGWNSSEVLAFIYFTIILVLMATGAIWQARSSFRRSKEV